MTTIKSIETRTAELTALGIPAELAAMAAAKAFADEMTSLDKARSEAQAEARKANGIVDFCGVPCSGMTYLDKDGKQQTNPMLKGAKALENGVGIEPAKVGGGVYYAPRLWVFTKGRTPWYLTQDEASTLHTIVTQHGSDKLTALLAAIGDQAAVATYKAEKARGIAAGEYQDTNNTRNRKTAKT